MKIAIPRLAPSASIPGLVLLRLILLLTATTALPADVPDTPATASAEPATAPTPRLTTLDANGFRVALDATGFEKVLGYEKFHGNYFRLAQFHAEKEHASEMGGGFTFSLLVDDLPKGARDVPGLLSHVLASRKQTDQLKDGRLKLIRPYKSINGLLYRYPQLMPVPQALQEKMGPEVRQWHWYFQAIQNGKWLEIHFSRMLAPDAPIPEGIEPAIDRILRSLQFPAPPGK